MESLTERPALRRQGAPLLQPLTEGGAMLDRPRELHGVENMVLEDIDIDSKAGRRPGAAAGRRIKDEKAHRRESRRLAEARTRGRQQSASQHSTQQRSRQQQQQHQQQQAATSKL